MPISSSRAGPPAGGSSPSCRTPTASGPLEGDNQTLTERRRSPALGQWRGPDLPPHLRGRRELSLHRHPERREQLGARRRAVPLFARRAPGHAARSPTSSSSTKARSACSARTTWCRRSITDLQNDKQIRLDNTGGWLGFTDKYWATAVLRRRRRRRSTRSSPISSPTASTSTRRASSKRRRWSSRTGATAEDTELRLRRRQGRSGHRGLREGTTSSTGSNC